MRAIIALVLLCPLVLAGDEEREEVKEKAAELAKRMASKDADERLAAVREAAEVHHKSLVSPLARLLKDKDRRIRLEATAVLGMRDEPKDRKAAAKALCTRIRPLEGKEENDEELLKVVGALHDLAQPCAIKPLLDGIKVDTSAEVVRARLMAVGNIPSPEAIERIIRFADMGRRGWKRHHQAARAALIYATGEKVEGGVDQWRRWWSDNKAHFDFDAAAEKRQRDRQAAKDKEAQRKKKAEERERRKREREKKKKEEKDKGAS